jgi:hypothetical protein
MHKDLNTKHLQLLEKWSQHIQKSRHGIENGDDDFFVVPSIAEELVVQFSGIFIWEYKVRVRRPWKFSGEDTVRLHGVYHKDVSFPVLDSSSASELIEAERYSSSKALAMSIESLLDNLGDPSDVAVQKPWWHELDSVKSKNGVKSKYVTLDLTDESWLDSLSDLEDDVWVSQHIVGYEGEEEDLVSIHEWRDGRSDFGPSLNSIVFTSKPIIKIGGHPLSDEAIHPLLLKAAELLPEGSLFNES